MAGRKQHFIPKHFLKGFVVSNRKNTLWMFRRGSPKPVSVSIQNAAAARDFYSKHKIHDIQTLDDLITEYENKLKFRVEDVRRIPKGKEISAHLISEIAVHLMIRAAYVREIIDECLSEIVRSIDELVNPNGTIFECLETQRHRVPLEFEEMVTKLYKVRRLDRSTNLSPKAMARVIYFALREDFDLFKNVASIEAYKLNFQLKNERKDLLRKAHMGLLEHDLVPASSKAGLERFNWRVVEYPTANAVLSDCVVIAKDNNGWSPYLMADKESITRVVLPIASDKLAVGCTDQGHNMVIDIYNLAARSCCFTFYLSNNSKEVSDRKDTRVGDNMRSRVSNLMSSVLIKSAKETFSDVTTNAQKELSTVKWTELNSKSPFQYSVSCRDFGDKGLAKNVADQLSFIVSNFTELYPIHGLDGFTFAHNYNEALQELDRGKGIRRKPVKHDPNGIAMPLAVRRNNSIKTHVVLRRDIAEYLVSNDEDNTFYAISVIGYCLGTVAFHVLVDGKFPGRLLSPILDPYEGYLYQFTDALLGTYFSCHMLYHKEENLKFFVDQALKQLNLMVNKTSEVHASYGLGYHNLDLISTSTNYVSSFLFALARVFGVGAFNGENCIPTLVLVKRLEQLGLGKWAILFEKDLAGFFRGLDEWRNWEDLFFINRHFERILLEVGVVVDQLTDGSIVFYMTSEHGLSAKANDQI